LKLVLKAVIELNVLPRDIPEASPEDKVGRVSDLKMKLEVVLLPKMSEAEELHLK
jgi:hypothetical protein